MNNIVQIVVTLHSSPVRSLVPRGATRSAMFADWRSTLSSKGRRLGKC